MARYKIPKLESSTFRGWAFVLVAGIVLAVIAIAHRGGLDVTPSAAEAAAQAGCRLEVVANPLNVRAEPDADAMLVETLPDGVQVEGTRQVVNGYRELSAGRWAADQYLTALPGTNCA